MIARLRARPIRWASGLLTMLAGLQVLVGLLLLSHRQEVEQALATVTISPDQLRTQVNGVVLGGAVVHALSAVVHVWLAVWCSRGRRWARRVATVVCVISTAAGLTFLRHSSVVLPAQWAAIAAEQGVSAALRVALVWLLWVPTSSRRFFESLSSA